MPYLRVLHSKLINTKMNTTGGQMTLIFGPMFSGKSSELQRMVRRYEISKKKCLIVNFALDSRYSDDDVVSTHDK